MNFWPSSWRSSPCPLWVKSRHLQCKKACPLYPHPNSGHRTLRLECPLSANSGHRSFDHLVGADEPRDTNRYSISGLAAGNTMLNTDP